MKNFIKQYSIKILITWLIAIFLIELLASSCSLTDRKKINVTHTVVDIDTMYSYFGMIPSNLQYYQITLEDSSTFTTTTKYSVGDTINYLYYLPKR